MAEFPLQYKDETVNGFIVSTIVLDGGRGIAESMIFPSADNYDAVGWARSFDRDKAHAEMVAKAKTL